MKENYKLIGENVYVNDTDKKFIEYEYQDNIEEILKQENVIEELENTIIGLKNRKYNINRIKSNFMFSLFDEKYGQKAFIIGFMGWFPAIIGMALELNNLLFRILPIGFVVASIPVAIVEYKKFKRDNELKLINIDEQTKEFEEILEKEKEKLVELKNNKCRDNINDMCRELIQIDNSKNETLVNIEKRKKIYEMYREDCGKIKKYSEKGIAQNKELDEMSKSANKTLMKRKNSIN